MSDAPRTPEEIARASWKSLTGGEDDPRRRMTTFRGAFEHCLVAAMAEYEPIVRRAAIEACAAAVASVEYEGSESDERRRGGFDGALLDAEEAVRALAGVPGA